MATIKNISAKYKDFISRSILIRSGPPAVYQLKSKKQEFGTLTRITVGDKNQDKPNKTILLMGETGAGKSTLINALFNYSMGVNWEDEVWFQIVEEKKKENQTSDVIVYEIFDFEGKTLPYSLTVIDTPGYGSTRGTENDDIVIQRLTQLFRSKDGVHEVHAVGVVMKASENQLSERLKYILDSAMSQYGKNVEKSTVALITHSDGMSPEKALKAFKAANPECPNNKNDQPAHFLFNNQQSTERTPGNIPVLKKASKVTSTGMHGLCDILVDKFRILKKTEPLSTTNGDGGFWSWIWPTYEKITRCTRCQENCHYPCYVDSLKLCVATKSGKCVVCTHKCAASNHVKDNLKYVD